MIYLRRRTMGSRKTIIDYSQMYFTIESLVNDNVIRATKSGSTQNPNIYYSLDDGETWSNQTLSSGTVNFGTVNTGDKVLLKCNIPHWATAWDKFIKFNCSGQFKVYGNVMSLIYGDNFINNSEFPENSSFNLCGLFYGITTLIDASDLILPALTLKTSSYNGMFRGATNLVHGPVILPATISAQDCYSSMFEGCINLEEAPNIELTTVATNCCGRMFCMSRTTKLTTPKLTKGPVLKIATLSNTCFKEMFKGNGNLVEVTCLATAGMSGNCGDWLLYCSTTGTFYKNSEATAWTTGTSAIPSGWTTQNYVEN